MCSVHFPPTINKLYWFTTDSNDMLYKDELVLYKVECRIPCDVRQCLGFVGLTFSIVVC